MTEPESLGLNYPLAFVPLAESAILIRIADGDTIDQAVVDAVTALTHAIDAAAITGVTDVVPAYATILISFEIEQIDHETIEHAVREIAVTGISSPDRDARLVIIPVVYGGEFGPDLNEMAAELGLPPERVTALHAGADYRVACMGFSPGWAYLLGLPPELTIPRRQNPRTRIPTGSVAVGGAQTGIYPLESPGGWRLIGRTPLAMFDPERADPFLLHQGDHVRFAPIDTDRYVELHRGRLDG